MTRRSLLAVLVSSLVVPALLAQDAALERDAKSMDTKLTALFANGQLPQGKAKPLRTQFTENEINAYMKLSKDVELPTGVRDPRLTIEGDNRLSGRAVVDLDKVRTSRQRSVLDPLNLLLRGTVEVTAKGVLRCANGSGQFQVESATLGGVPIPKTVLQELVYFYTRTPEHPNGYNLDQPFELPMNIRAIEFVRGTATIVQ